MKNVIKHSKKGILMVTLFATMLSFANEASFFTIKNDAKRTALTLNNVKEGNLLSIKDYNGVILYKELIQKSGVYTKGFDLTSLPDGSYNFEFDKDLEIKTIPFSVTSGIVLFNKEEEKSIFKPFVRVEGDLVYVSRLTLNGEPLTIDIFFTDSSYSELMYSEKIKDVKTIERIYKLTGLHKGSYKMVLYYGNRELTKIIN